MSLKPDSLRRIVAFLVCTALLFSQVAMAEEFKLKDVPPDHWAYQSIKYLIDKGYLSVYQDDTFQGAKPVDRYTLAAILARILKDIEAGKVVPAAAGDVDLLRKLTDEFRGELVSLGEKVSSVEAKLDQMAKKTTIQGDEITKLTADLRDVARQTGELQGKLASEVKALQSNIEELQGEIGKLQEGASSLSGRLDALNTRLGDVEVELLSASRELEEGFKKDIADLNSKLGSRVDEQGKAIAALSDKLSAQEKSLGDTQGRVTSLEEAVAALREQDAAHSQSIAALKEDYGAAIESLKGQNATQDEAIGGLKEQDLACGQAIEALKSENAAQAEAIAALEKQVKAQGDDILTLRGELEAQKKTLEGLTSELKAVSDRLESAVVEINASLNALALRIGGLEERVGKNEEGLAALNKQLASLKGDLESKLESERVARISADSLLQENANKLASDLDALRAKMDKEIKGLQEKNNTIMILAGILGLLGFLVK